MLLADDPATSVYDTSSRRLPVPPIDERRSGAHQACPAAGFWFASAMTPVKWLAPAVRAPQVCATHHLVMPATRTIPAAIVMSTTSSITSVGPSNSKRLWAEIYHDDATMTRGGVDASSPHGRQRDRGRIGARCILTKERIATKALQCLTGQPLERCRVHRVLVPEFERLAPACGCGRYRSDGAGRAKSGRLGLAG